MDWVGLVWIGLDWFRKGRIRTDLIGFDLVCSFEPIIPFICTKNSQNAAK
jgi:hypothetical protein